MVGETGIPIGASALAGKEYGFPDPLSGSAAWMDRFQTADVTQFRGAQLLADRYDILRRDMEASALESHKRALRALHEKRFAREVIPFLGLTDDEPLVIRVWRKWRHWSR
jgi:acetyl-CoA C-acetyltransferase